MNIGVEDVFKYFSITKLTTKVEEFIFEYVKIMAPLANALDILQGDKKVSIGYLLPTICVLKMELEKLKRSSNIKHCHPLIEGI